MKNKGENLEKEVCVGCFEKTVDSTVLKSETLESRGKRETVKQGGILKTSLRQWWEYNVVLKDKNKCF